jgi:hypothetical protein
MDDIKESVRVAATKAVSAMSRVCIKMCDVTQSPKSGEEAVKAILVIAFSFLMSPFNLPLDLPVSSRLVALYFMP